MGSIPVALSGMRLALVDGLTVFETVGYRAFLLLDIWEREVITPPHVSTEESSTKFHNVLDFDVLLSYFRIQGLRLGLLS